MEIPDIVRGYEGKLKHLELQGIIKRKDDDEDSHLKQIKTVEDFDRAMARFG